MATPVDQRLARELVNESLLTPQQAQQALAMVGTQPGLSLAGLLVQRGVISVDQARALMARGAAPSDQQLAEHLLQNGILSSAQLGEAHRRLQALRGAGHAIGLADFLVREGWVDPRLLPSGAAPPAPQAPGFASGSGSSANFARSGSTPGYGSAPAHYGSGVTSGSSFGPGSSPHSSSTTGSNVPQTSAGASSRLGGIRPDEATAAALEAAGFGNDDPLTRRFPARVGPDGEAVVTFGDYDVLGEVARGGMGIVYRARERAGGRIVALKVIKQGEHAREKHIRRFQQETETASRLKHPHIVEIFGSDCVEGFHFYTMELVEGGALDERVKRGELPAEADALRIMKQLCEAVHYAHEQQIIHRDLKPANVLFDNAERPKLTDFGLAKDVTQRSKLTRTGAVVGTPYYMPPEQARGDMDIDARCDVYALGVILYELLTGTTPFRGETSMEVYQRILDEEARPPSELAPAIRAESEIICLKAIAKHRADRYETALAMAEDLASAMAGEAIRARRPGLGDKVSAFIRDNRRQALIIAGILAAVLLIGAVGTVVLVRRSARAAARAEAVSWEAFRTGLDKRLTALETNLNQLRTARRGGDLEAAEKALAALDKAFAELPAASPHKGLPASRTGLHLACLDQTFRARLFKDGAPLDAIDVAAITADRERLKSLYGFTPEFDAGDLADFQRFVARRSSYDAEPPPAEFQVKQPLPRRALDELMRDARAEQARLQLARKTPKKAIASLRRALEFESGSREALALRVLLARRLRLADRVELARAEVDAVLQADPSRSDARLELARLLARAGQTKDAEEEFGKVIESDLEPFEALVGRGRARLEQESWQAALDDFQRALKLRANSYEAYTGCGAAYLGLGSLENAKLTLSEAIDRDARRPEALELRIKVHEKLGDAAAAAKDRARLDRVRGS